MPVDSFSGILQEGEQGLFPALKRPYLVFEEAV
jgi:hypothetical protein